jgi:type II secretory ATPase GspE/PulE/Tfp pilus assembly ATPase PilB-like protein
MGTLLHIRRGGAVQTIPFAKDEIRIGRGSENDVVLADDLASRNHAVVFRRPDGYWVRDLASRNGTRFHGELLTSPERLVPGEAFQIGRHLISVETDLVPGSGGARPSPKAGAAEVLTSDDLVEVEDEFDAHGGLGAMADVVGDDFDVTPQVQVERAAAPAPKSVFDETYDDASAEEHLARLAANLPNQTFEASAVEMTDAAGQLVHSGANKAGAKKKATKGDAVEMLRLLLLVCYRGRATDLHLEPRQDGHYVRLRIDGVMVDIAHMPVVTGNKLSTVVKILCQIDIAQRKSIQEGSFAARVPDGTGKFRRIDYRVSFAPAVLGQKLVIRILDASAAPSMLADLNMPPAMTDKIARTLKRDSGMILVAGPTGSGKTTTLYSLLRSIDLARLNVVTIEDPVEVHLEGATQIPVDDQHDRSFLQLLRSVLRQDPDVILVGEIRDAETARVAMQASITGHMVFSTVHTQDTVGTIFRLRDLGIEPYMLGQGLQVVIAQRLTRQLCPHCKRAVEPTARQRQVLTESLGAAAGNVKKLFKPVGCPQCLNTGHVGRRAFFELLTNSVELSEAVFGNPTRAELIGKLGPEFRTLRQGAYELVVAGQVAFEEVEHEQATIG